jgi:radical SAM protein with 4Fe4S-binding SPASM domain
LVFRSIFVKINLLPWYGCAFVVTLAEIGNSTFMQRLTLHLRLTKKCNADCVYCSSWQEKALPYMTADHFAQSIDFICDHVLPVMGLQGGVGSHASLQYTGGEILVVPRPVLRECVLYGRQRLGRIFENVTDGCQSNLQGSDDRIAYLSTLFGRRISTSIDDFTDQRRLKGSSERYRQQADHGRALLKRRRGHNPAVIYVVDGAGVAHAPAQYQRAEQDGADITLRAVFHGGRAVGAATIPELITAYGEVFDAWIMKGRVAVQPLYQLLTTWLAVQTGDSHLMTSNFGCPFQKNCAQVSLDLEPNGDLFICLDMADSGQMKLGNAIAGEFNTDIWSSLNDRQQHYDSKCRQCRWLAACQGGCMSEAIHHTGSPYGRTELCALWTSLFQRIDQAIEEHGQTALVEWCRSLQTPSLTVS